MYECDIKYEFTRKIFVHTKDAKDPFRGMNERYEYALQEAEVLVIMNDRFF